MSKLNPDPFRGKVSSPSFLGASRGRSAVAEVREVADTSGAAVAADVNFDKGKTAQSLANFGLSLFQTVDQGIQRGIKREIQEETDTLNAELGAGEKPVGLEVPGATPAQVNNAGKELKKLAQAQAAGEMGDTYYWGRVNSIVRQMRAKYPAYRDEIDEMVSGITGQRPANALRRALLAENTARAQGRMTARERATMNLKIFMSKEGILLGPKQDGTPHSLEELMMHVNEFNSGKAKLTQRKTRLENAQLTATEREEETRQVLRQEIAFTVRNEFSAITSSNSEFSKTISRALEIQKNGGVPSPQDLASIKTSMQQVKLRSAQVLNRFRATYGGEMSGKGIEEEISFMNNFVDGMISAVENQNFRVLKADMDYLNAMKTGDNIAVLKSSNRIRITRALAEFMPSFKVDEYVFMGSEDSTMDVLDNIRLANMSTKGESLNRQIEDAKRAGEFNKKTAARLMERAKKGIFDKDVSSEFSANSIKSLFGRDNRGFLTNINKEEERYIAFQQLTTPKLSKRVKELSEDNPVLWNNYRDWVLHSFNALFQEEINTAQTVPINRKFIKLGYDNSTNQLKVIPRKEVLERLPSRNPGRLLSDLVEIKVLEPQARSAIDNLNAGLRSLVPMLSIDGGSPGEEILKVIQASGIKFKTEEKGPDIENLFVSIASIFDPGEQREISQITEGPGGTSQIGN